MQLYEHSVTRGRRPSIPLRVGEGIGGEVTIRAFGI